MIIPSKKGNSHISKIDGKRNLTSLPPTYPLDFNLYTVDLSLEKLNVTKLKEERLFRLKNLEDAKINLEKTRIEKKILNEKRKAPGLNNNGTILQPTPISNKEYITGSNEISETPSFDKNDAFFKNLIESTKNTSAEIKDTTFEKKRKSFNYSDFEVSTPPPLPWDINDNTSEKSDIQELIGLMSIQDKKNVDLDKLKTVNHIQKNQDYMDTFPQFSSNQQLQTLQSSSPNLTQNYFQQQHSNNSQYLNNHQFHGQNFSTQGNQIQRTPSLPNYHTNFFTNNSSLVTENRNSTLQYQPSPNSSQQSQHLPMNNNNIVHKCLVMGFPLDKILEALKLKGHDENKVILLQLLINLIIVGVGALTQKLLMHIHELNENLVSS